VFQEFSEEAILFVVQYCFFRFQLLAAKATAPFVRLQFFHTTASA
jgi:hypothetical protein